LIFVPAGLLFLTQLSGEIGSSKTVYGGIGRKIMVVQSLFSMFGQRAEMLLALPILIGTILLRSAKIITIHPRFLFVGIALLIIGLLAPYQLFGVAFVGLRFPLLAMAVFIAGIEEFDLKKARIAAGVLAVLIAGKLFIVKNTFSYADTQTRELRAALQTLPAGSKILPVLNFDAALKSPLSPQHYFHPPAYFVIDRDGLIPYLFSMFNVGVHEEHIPYTSQYGGPVNLANFDTDRAIPYAKNWRRDIDYIVVMDNTGAKFIHMGVSPVSKGGHYSIHKVTPNEPR